jgi:hypothetical protein
MFQNLMDMDWHRHATMCLYVIIIDEWLISCISFKSYIQILPSVRFQSCSPLHQCYRRTRAITPFVIAKKKENISWIVMSSIGRVSEDVHNIRI